MINDIMTFNDFLSKESFDIIQDILKKFNIDIFFNTWFFNFDIDLKPLNMYLQFKNKNFKCFIHRNNLILSSGFSLKGHILQYETFDLNDFYIIYNYIRNNIPLNHFMFIDYMIISDNENNVKQFKDFLLKQYNIKISECVKYKERKDFYSIVESYV